MTLRSPTRTAYSFGLFAVLFTIFSASPVRTPFDSRWAVATAMSFARGHWGDLTEYMPILEAEHAYSIEYSKGQPRTLFPIGVSVLSVPAMWIVSAIDPAFNRELRYAVPVELEGLLAAAYGGLMGVLFFRIIFNRFRSLSLALGGTMIFCFGTSIWSTATRALWQHTAVVLMFVVAVAILFAARTQPHVIQYLSVPLAMALISRPTAAVAIMVLSLYVLLYYPRWFVRYLLWSLPLAAPWLTYNLAVYDAPFAPYYVTPHTYGDWTTGEALAGNLFSPSRGLFVYSPVLLLALVGLYRAVREATDRALHIAFALIVVLHWFVVSHLGKPWWGGHSYGPRFMTDVVPFLAYFVMLPLSPEGLSESWKKIYGLCTVLLAAISVLMHAQGALNWAPYEWNSVPTNIDASPSRLWNWRDPQFARRPWKVPPRQPLLNLTKGSVPPAVKPYTAGAVLQFRAHPFLDRTPLRSGWSEPESWGVWSDGPEAQLAIAADPSRGVVDNKDLLMILRVTAFVAPGHPQTVDVLVNDTQLARWVFEAGDGQLERRIQVPAAVVRFPLMISFHIQNPLSPAELGWSADRRHLGIGLQRLRLVRLEEAM